jgi:hypothetical protein
MTHTLIPFRNNVFHSLNNEPFDAADLEVRAYVAEILSTYAALKKIQHNQTNLMVT